MPITREDKAKGGDSFNAQHDNAPRSSRPTGVSDNSVSSRPSGVLGTTYRSGGSLDDEMKYGRIVKIIKAAPKK